MKRLRNITAIAVVLIFCVSWGIPVFAINVDGTVVEDGHGWESTWVRQKDPTCTEYGEEVLYCKYCPKTVTRSVAPLGHELTTVITKEATCEEPGLQLTTCSRCDYREEQVLPSLGHDLHTVVEKEATCKEQGLQVVTCSRCDYREEKVLPLLEHRLAVREQAPSEELEGSREIYCERCGEVINRQILPKAVSRPLAVEHTTSEAIPNEAANETPNQTQPSGSTSTKESIEPIPEDKPVAEITQTDETPKEEKKISNKKKSSFFHEYLIDGIMGVMLQGVSGYGIVSFILYHNLCRWEKKKRKNVYKRIKREVMK